MKAIVVLAILGALTFLFSTAYGFGYFENQKQYQKEIVTPTPYLLKEEKLWKEVQVYRKTNNLPLYEKHNDLCVFAHKRLTEIKVNLDNHEGAINQWEKELPSFKSFGENLAKDFSSEDETLYGWVQSPTHLANLQANYKYSCIATDGNNVVHLFGNY